MVCVCLSVRARVRVCVCVRARVCSCVGCVGVCVCREGGVEGGGASDITEIRPFYSYFIATAYTAQCSDSRVKRSFTRFTQNRAVVVYQFI